MAKKVKWGAVSINKHRIGDQAAIDSLIAQMDLVSSKDYQIVVMGDFLVAFCPVEVEINES